MVVPADPPLLDKNALQKAMNAAASSYDQHSVLQQEVARRLLNRLELIKLQPKTVLDFGARTGFTTTALRDYYPAATVYGYDFSQKMLHQAPQDLTMITGDYTELPFADHSVELIFSNLTFHWSIDIKQTLEECQRLLKPDGLLIFSMVGPDTLHELSSSFDDKKPHVHAFVDMHDIGDLLQGLHFSGPVMDMERLILHYDDVKLLLQDLKKSGCHNITTQRSRGLMGQDEWQRMLFNYNKQRGGKEPFSATVEVIYGHAFGADLAGINDAGEVSIPVDHIKRRL